MVDYQLTILRRQDPLSYIVILNQAKSDDKPLVTPENLSLC